MLKASGTIQVRMNRSSIIRQLNAVLFNQYAAQMSILHIRVLENLFKRQMVTLLVESIVETPVALWYLFVFGRHWLMLSKLLSFVLFFLFLTPR